MKSNHGGDLGTIMHRFGHRAQDILDLSTGIAPRPWPVPADLCDAAAWQALPQSRDEAALCDALRQNLNLNEAAAICLAPGSQSLINLAPRLPPRGRVLIPDPAYGEHAAAWGDASHRVSTYAAGTCPQEAYFGNPALYAENTSIVAVQPGNPLGDYLPPQRLYDLACRVGERGGLVVVDEAFADLIPGASLAPFAGAPGLLVLRSFGKFYGLAGLRLGFALGARGDITRLKRWLGPWAVSAPALKIGAAALADAAFQDGQRLWLNAQNENLAGVLETHGVKRIGGTALYVLAEVSDAPALQDHLARAGIWTRIFPAHPGWIRFGLPPDTGGLARLDAALGGWPDKNGGIR